MVRKCTEPDRTKLQAYLKEEAVYNTFLLADIADFGFDSSFQTVYIDEEDDGIKGVYLCFYQNLILYSKGNHVNQAFLKNLFLEYMPDVVMGKKENVDKVGELLPEYHMECKNLYLLETDAKLIEEEEGINKGTLPDVDDIFDFIQTIPEIKMLYTSKQMIFDRIEKQTGTHYLIRDNGELIAHANSAAACEYTTMIGGVATAKTHRGRNAASYIVSRLCRDILANDKMPCLFCNREEEHNLFCKIGFHKAGEWGTMCRK